MENVIDLPGLNSWYKASRTFSWAKYWQLSCFEYAVYRCIFRQGYASWYLLARALALMKLVGQASLLQKQVGIEACSKSKNQKHSFDTKLSSSWTQNVSCVPHAVDWNGYDFFVLGSDINPHTSHDLTIIMVLSSTFFDQRAMVICSPADGKTIEQHDRAYRPVFIHQPGASVHEIQYSEM